MCFNGQMSAAFAAFGLAIACFIHARTRNTKLAVGVYFFFSMELLQAIQYLYLAADLGTPLCDTFINKFLTILGFLHICMQPYFTHLLNESLTRADVTAFELHEFSAKCKLVKRLCLLGGLHLFLRWPLSYIPGWSAQGPQTLGDPLSTEWIRGHELCTFKSEAMVHLGWSVPMTDVSYNMPGTSIHCFLMFAPLLAMHEKGGMSVFHGLFLYLTGPFAASLITSNLMEQASIWCFFSIAQIAITLFAIRGALNVNWHGDAVKEPKTSEPAVP